MQRLRRRDGANLVEFALVLPLLLILVFGIVDFGLALYDKAVVTNASREGARAGMVYRHPARVDDAEIEAVVNNYLASRLVSAGMGSASVSISRTGNSSGDSLTVTVQYFYNHFAIGDLVPGLGSLNLTATTVMRME